MKKSLIAFALCGMAFVPALTSASAAFASDSSSVNSPLPQDKMLYPWEENLKENVAARSFFEEQATGIPYGVEVLGMPSPLDR